jgi:hypothetical protein
MHQPTTLATLGDFLTHRDYEIAAHCAPCRRHDEIDLDVLARRYGPELAITDLRRRLRCSQYGTTAGLTIALRNAGMVAHHGAWHQSPPKRSI